MTTKQYGVMHAVPKILVDDEVAFANIKDELGKWLLKDLEQYNMEPDSEIDFIVTPYSGELGLFANEQMLVRLYVTTK